MDVFLKDFIHLIKENITATIAIGMSGDDFLQKSKHFMLFICFNLV